MRLNLKTTVLLSTLLAVGLNVCAFANSLYKQSHGPFLASSAIAPSTATASTGQTTAAPVQRAQVATLIADTSPASTAPASSLSITATLLNAGLKPDFADLYLSVQNQTGTPWQLLAAVHQVETGQSGSTARSSYAGATGPMQFMPATFAHYALDGDGNGTKDISNVNDAMLTAGRYLAAGGADRGNYSTALYNYNHSSAYVSRVLGIAHQLGL